MAMVRSLETLNKILDEVAIRKSKTFEETAEIRKTLNGLYKSRDEEDVKNQKDLELSFDGWKDKSAKALAESLYKKKMTTSSQLADNITKFEFGLSVKERELKKIQAEENAIKQEAKEVSANKNAQAAGDEINTFLEKYMVLQDYFENEFKSVINIANSSDPKWPGRLKNLGFRAAYEVTGVSFLKPGNLVSLNIESLIERIQSLRGYGEPLLAKKDRNVQPARENYNGYNL